MPGVVREADGREAVGFSRALPPHWLKDLAVELGDPFGGVALLGSREGQVDADDVGPPLGLLGECPLHQSSYVAPHGLDGGALAAAAQHPRSVAALGLD